MKRHYTSVPNVLATAVSVRTVQVREFSPVRWLAVLLLCCYPRATHAQTAVPLAQSASLPEGSPASVGSPLPTVPAVPKEPAVDDPMLVPPPRPQRELANWNEAAIELRARSTSLATAYAEVVKAEAQSRIALATLLPSINGNATATHQFITNKITTITSVNPTTNVPTTLTTYSPPTDYISGSVTLVQDLIDAKAWYDLRTAHAAEVVQRLSVESAKRTMTLSLATSMVAVVTAERVAEINRIALRSALELLNLTKLKKSWARPPAWTSCMLTRMWRPLVRQLSRGMNHCARRGKHLGLALGEAQQVGVASGLNLDGVLDSVGQACRRLNNSNDRPELAQARQQLAVAERGIHSAELSFLPTLKAQSTVSSSTLNPGAAPRTTWNILAVLTVPIWDGGARYGTLRTARAVRDEAGYSLEATRRSVTIEVEQARRSVEVAEQSVAVARNAAVLAARNDELTRISYRLGQGVTSFELVAAAVALQQAQVQLAVQEFGVVGARLSALLTMARCTE